MKNSALHILLIEDDAIDARLIRGMFTEEDPFSLEMTHVVSMSDAETYLASGGAADIVLVDMGLPDAQGLDTIQRAQTAAPGVPLIVLTGLDDEGFATAALKAGAQDYLIKGQVESRALPRALRHAIDRYRMQAETDLARMQQVQLRDELLTHASHELRSPLTSIYLFSSLIADGLAGELNQQMREYIDVVLSNVSQLTGMVNELLDVANLRAGSILVEPRSVSVHDVIMRTLEGFGRIEGISIVFEPAFALPLAYADPARLEQILIILIDNAVKFTPRGGSIDVRATLVESPTRFVQVEVADTGCGIAPEESERIFLRLYQVAGLSDVGRKGLGLGLSIANQLVTKMNGRMWVHSELEKGSRFFFSLPLAP